MNIRGRVNVDVTSSLAQPTMLLALHLEILLLDSFKFFIVKVDFLLMLVHLILQV